MHQRADGLKVAGAFAAIYVLWGGTYLAIALGLQSIPAFILIASRSLIGGGVLLYYRIFEDRSCVPLAIGAMQPLAAHFFSWAATALLPMPSDRFHPAFQRFSWQQSRFGSCS